MEDEFEEQPGSVEEFIESEIELLLKRDPEILAHLMKFYDGTYTAHQLGETLGAHIDEAEDKMRLEAKEYELERHEHNN